MAKREKLLSVVSVALLAALCAALPVADRVWYGGALLGGGQIAFAVLVILGAALLAAELRKKPENRRWSAAVSPRARIAGAVIDAVVILLQIRGGMHGLLLGCLTIGLFAAAGLESLLAIRNSSRVGRGLFLIALSMLLCTAGYFLAVRPIPLAQAEQLARGLGYEQLAHEGISHGDSLWEEDGRGRMGFYEDATVADRALGHYAFSAEKDGRRYMVYVPVASSGAVAQSEVGA